MDIQTIITFIGVIATISIPLILYYKGNKKKSLVFEELHNLSVVNVKKDFKDKIEIKYVGKSVDNLFVSTAKIKNEGNLSIKKSEIIKPIEIIFDKKILDCNVIDISPKGIDVSLITNSEGNSIGCEFNLLNPNDYFILQFVSLEKLSIPTIISRIEGLSQIDIDSNMDEKYQSMEQKLKIIFILIYLLVAIVVMYYFWYSFNHLFGSLSTNSSVRFFP